MSKAGIIVHEQVLPNGLKIIGEYHPAARSSAMGFFVKTGARDESIPECGISHFLEHMMFKGTASRTSMDITYQLGSLGAQSNAYTSEESTVYYGAVLPENLAAFQELLSDMVRPALDPDEFNMEKKVILEEIALYLDRPVFQLLELSQIEFFQGHKAGNSVIGTTQSVGAITRDQMHAYYSRRYAPNNMVLAVAGQFDWQKFVTAAEKQCGGWARFETPRETPPFLGRVVQKQFTKSNLQQAHLLLMMVGPSQQDDERFPLAVLSMILGDSVGSKLYWALVNNGIAESASFDIDERDGTGIMHAYTSTAPERLAEVRGILLKVLENPMDFSEADLERAKTKLLSRIVLSGELPMGRMMALGTEWLMRKKIHSLRELMDRVKKVDRVQIETALKRYPIAQWSEFTMVPE
jgi:predicted Zn-dependent peptidase